MQRDGYEVNLEVTSSPGASSFILNIYIYIYIYIYQLNILIDYKILQIDGQEFNLEVITSSTSSAPFIRPTC